MDRDALAEAYVARLYAAAAAAEAQGVAVARPEPEPQQVDLRLLETRYSEYDLLPENMTTSANHEEFPQAGGHLEFNQMTSDDDAPSPTTSGTVYINQDVAQSVDSAEKYLQELNVFMDRLDAARAIVEHHSGRLKDEINDLKKKNPDIRQRGLRGGKARKQNAGGPENIAGQSDITEQSSQQEFIEVRNSPLETDIDLNTGRARKQMAIGVPFISITKLAPAERQRQKLKAIFKSCYKLIEEQQTLAEQVVEHGNSLVCEYATLIEAHEAYPPYDATGPNGHQPRRSGGDGGDVDHIRDRISM
ncbi:hypothetical protein LTR99_005214 [Exophiala xenobiotica]|nr:hypothetical protein LTR40_002665 [Exophiala xenobiotica]KAK5270770.1 hypothetical protein LTR96_004048 [Exophiala xenobiotica]KAK5303452.1 hypothetical protein LTR99_005214 [Exophiala xenobiotica]KAK5339660.1 hypothetical protein LTR98_004462 [Exophiala xenobiotica]KAK5436555.1 hypothetical protein LTR34_002186 [Exophiala xenobiotica]